MSSRIRRYVEKICDGGPLNKWGYYELPEDSDPYDIIMDEMSGPIGYLNTILINRIKMEIEHDGYE